MAVNLPILWERMRSGRVRILWLVLGAMLLIAVLFNNLIRRRVMSGR